MRNRFQTDNPRPHLLRRAVSSIAITGCGIALLLTGTHSVLTTSSKSQAESLKNAILRSAVSCYAFEGTYPESLSYLKEHYGLLIDEEEYRVNYHYEGANIAPHIDVYKKGRIYENAS